MTAPLVAFGVSAAIAAILVTVPALRAPLTRAATGPRWRADAVPVSGGIAMAIGFLVAAAMAARGARGLGAIVAASTLLLVMGVVDDLHPLPPIVKLAGHVVGGVILATFGVHPDLPGGAAVGVIAAVAWFVLVTNAVNLLDGMDGLAGGIGMIAGITLWLWNAPAPLAAVFVGAVAGFLPLNLPAARMFMGNGGSHWMGAMLAGLTLLDGGSAGGTLPGAWASVFVPVVLLAVPLFDTCLVVVERLRHGRRVTVGGTDHTSHRMVAMGMSEWQTVGSLWLVGLGAAGAASLIRVGPGAFAVAGAALAAVLMVLGARLARARVYD